MEKEAICPKCGWTWKPRVEFPRRCPRLYPWACMNPYPLGEPPKEERRVMGHRHTWVQTSVQQLSSSMLNRWRCFECWATKAQHPETKVIEGYNPKTGRKWRGGVTR